MCRTASSPRPASGASRERCHPRRCGPVWTARVASCLPSPLGVAGSVCEDGRFARQGDASGSRTLDLEVHGPACCLMEGGGEPDAVLVDQDDQTVVATDGGEVRALRGKGWQPKLLAESGHSVGDIRNADADLADGQRPGASASLAEPSSASRAMNSRRMSSGPRKYTDVECHPSGPTITSEPSTTIGSTRWPSHARASSKFAGTMPNAR